MGFNPFLQRDWARSSRKGGPFWTAGGFLIILAVVISIVKGCL